MCFNMNPKALILLVEIELKILGEDRRQVDSIPSRVFNFAPLSKSNEVSLSFHNGIHRLKTCWTLKVLSNSACLEEKTFQQHEKQVQYALCGLYC